MFEIEVKSFMEVYVVYARTEPFLGVVNQFGEVRVWGVYDSFDNALKKFNECIDDAIFYTLDDEDSYVYDVLDFDLLKKAADKSPFQNYNLNSNKFGDICWKYEINEDGITEWRMFAVGLDKTECPVLPCAYIEKYSVQSEYKSFNECIGNQSNDADLDKELEIDECERYSCTFEDECEDGYMMLSFDDEEENIDEE